MKGDGDNIKNLSLLKLANSSSFCIMKFFDFGGGGKRKNGRGKNKKMCTKYTNKFFFI